MPLHDLAPFGWALLLAGSFIVGISKTALPGAATLSVAAFAAVLPAKASTGALLVLLIVGDVFALALYRRDADLRTLLRLAPAVLVGLVLGSVFLALSDDRWVKLVIGVILLALTAFTLWRRGGSGAAPGGGRAARVGYGALGGFTTMVANAGGPVMSLYFLAARFPGHGSVVLRHHQRREAALLHRARAARLEHVQSRPGPGPRRRRGRAHRALDRGPDQAGGLRPGRGRDDGARRLVPDPCGVEVKLAAPGPKPHGRSGIADQ